MVRGSDSKVTHARLPNPKDPPRGLHGGLRVRREVHEDNVAAVSLQVDGCGEYPQRSDHDLHRIVEVIENDDNEFSIVLLVNRTDPHYVVARIHEINLDVSLSDRPIAKTEKLAVIDVAHLMC